MLEVEPEAGTDREEVFESQRSVDGDAFSGVDNVGQARAGYGHGSSGGRLADAACLKFVLQEDDCGVGEGSCRFLDRGWD